jgi:hypothetical protein
MKTAVEWLQEEVERILKSSLHREQAEQLWESFEEAKEMEKEQAELYAEFAVLNDRSENPLIPFNEFINIDNL